MLIVKIVSKNTEDFWGADVNIAILQIVDQGQQMFSQAMNLSRGSRGRENKESETDLSIHKITLSMIGKNKSLKFSLA